MTKAATQRAPRDSNLSAMCSMGALWQAPNTDQELLSSHNVAASSLTVGLSFVFSMQVYDKFLLNF